MSTNEGLGCASAPRRWGAPAEPGLDVVCVADRNGAQWQRTEGLGGRDWENVRGFPVRQFTWSDLFWNHGPLTEVMLP